MSILLSLNITMKVPINSRDNKQRYMICDYEDEKELSQYAWYCDRGRIRNRTHGLQASKVVILRCSDKGDAKTFIEHINGDTLDLRRENLRWTDNNHKKL